MEISEQDIFNYVYYPEKLTPEKHNFIESNKKRFEEQIKLCENTLSVLKEKYANTKKIIILEKKPVTYIPKQPQFYLAADSITLDKSIRTETYINNENNILVKAVFYNDKTKIFVFNEGTQSITNIRLIVQTAEKPIQIGNINEPIELPAGLEIKSINVEL